MAFLKHLLPAWKTRLEDKSTANGAILSAIETELKTTEIEAIQSKILLALNTSEGEWLDQYGKLFGVIRQDNETDDTYRARMISYILLERGTVPAIQEAIKAFLNNYDVHIEIYEPYVNVFTLNKSLLNGEDHFLGKYYTVAVIDIQMSVPFPVGIVDVINEFKAAGVTAHLTFTPGTYDPNAEVVNEEFQENRQIIPKNVIREMTGMTDRIRGHLNLTTRTSTDEEFSGIFKTNSSRLNSLDRLAGARSVTNPAFNLASITTDNISLNNGSTIANVLSLTEELPSDWYSRTDGEAEQYAAASVSSDEDTYIHCTLDVATFLDTKYNTYLREAEPSGLYTKSTYLSLMTNPNFHYRFRAEVSPENPSSYSVELLNVTTGRWTELATGEVKYEQIHGQLNISDMSSYLTSSGLVFARIKIKENTNMTGVYGLHVYFLELSFSKNVATRPTIKLGVKEVGTSSILVDIPPTPRSFDGGNFDDPPPNNIIDGGTF